MFSKYYSFVLIFIKLSITNINSNNMLKVYIFYAVCCVFPYILQI